MDNNHAFRFLIKPFASSCALVMPPSRSLSLAQEHSDARLTNTGKEQCAALKDSEPGIEKEAQLVIVSPLTRALQTATLTIEKVHSSMKVM